MPASVSSSTLAAQLEDAPVPDSNEWVQFLNGGKASHWNRRTNATVWQSPPGVNVVWVGKLDEEGSRTTGTGIRVSVGMAFLLLLGDGQRGEELGIPSPLHQCHLWQDDVLVSCSFGGESGCIYSDMLENSCGIAVIAGWFCWYDAPRALFPSIVHDRCDSTGAVLGPGAMPVVVVSGADVQTAHYCVVSTGAVLGQVVQFPVVVQRLIPMVFCSEDHIFLLLPLNKMIDVPVALAVQIPCIWQSLCGVRCSPVEYQTSDLRIQHSLVRQWIHVGVSLRDFWEFSHVLYVKVQVLQFFRADVEKTAELPQLQLVEFGTVVACSLCAATGAVLSMTWRSSSALVDKFQLRLALCFFPSSGPRCAASWPVWIRGTVVSVLGWFASCLDKVVHTPVVCNDMCLWFRLQKTVQAPQLQYV